MAKTIKFNLICDNTPVRTIEDLQNNFSIQKICESAHAKSLSEAARASNLSYFNRPFIKEVNDQICFVDIIVSVVAHLGKIRDANRIFQLSHVLLPSKKTHYCKCNIMCKSAQVPRIIEAVIMLRSIWLLYSSPHTFHHGWLQILPPA